MTEVTSDFRCHMRHIRAADMCSRGARAWFQQRDLSWTDFLANGVPQHILAATGDPLALRVVEAARAEHNGR